MMADPKRYPTTKDSGLEWLGDVPTHWEVRQLGRMGTLSKGNGGSKADEEPVGVPCVRYGDLYTTHTRFIRSSRAFVSQARAADYTPLKHGEVLFAASGETIDEIGKSAVNLISSGACCGGDIIVFRPKYRTHPPFMGYVTDCWSSATQKATMGRGFTVVHIYATQLKQLVLPVPPLPEQAAIARYLDHADRRIRLCIHAKEKLVKLLEEQRQVLVNEAVMGRVDVRNGQPYPAYKQSGVEWLGEVPAHWEVLRLRNAVTMRVSNVDKHVREGETPVRLCNYIDVYKHDCISQRIDFMRATATPEEIERYRLEEGDVLITKDSEAWDDIGVPAVVTEPAEDLISGYHLALLRPIADVLIGAYLLRALQGKGLAHQFHIEAKGVTRYGLSHAGIKSVWIAVPPLHEQAAIVRYLDHADRRIRRYVESAQRQVQLLNDYRTRLIADVVTGKLDVRETASELANDLEEPEVITGLDDSAVKSGESACNLNVVTQAKEA